MKDIRAPNSLTRREYYSNIKLIDYICLFIVSLLNGMGRLAFGVIINTLLSSITALYKDGFTSKFVAEVLSFLNIKATPLNLVACILAAWLISRILYFIAKQIYIYVNYNVFTRINRMTAAFINNIPLETYLNKKPGTIKERVFHLDKNMGAVMSIIFEQFIPEMIFVIISLVKLWFLSKKFMLMVGLWVVLHGATTIISMIWLRKYAADQVKINSERSGFYVEMCNLFMLNQFFQLQNILTDRADKQYNKKYLQAGAKLYRFEAIITLMKTIVMWSIIGFIGYRTMACELMAGQMRISVFTDLFSTLLWLTSGITSLGQYIAQLLSSMQIINTGLEFMEQNQPIPAKSTDIIINEPIHTIECNNISLSYVEDDEQKTIFENVNLKISQKQSVVIVGPSGYGKTSLLNAITGMIPISEGEIYINGINIQQINKHELVKNIVYIAQSSVLIDDTINYNISLANQNISHEELSNLITKFKLPEGNRKVGNAGVKLSGGQRQRVCIARAIAKYKPGDLIICDEITSSLDAELSEQIIKYLIELAKNNNSIIIFVDHSKNAQSRVESMIKFRTSDGFTRIEQIDLQSVPASQL